MGVNVCHACGGSSLQLVYVLLKSQSFTVLEQMYCIQFRWEVYVHVYTGSEKHEEECPYILISHNIEERCWSTLVSTIDQARFVFAQLMMFHWYFLYWPCFFLLSLIAFATYLTIGHAGWLLVKVGVDIKGRWDQDNNFWVSNSLECSSLVRSRSSPPAI